MRGPIAPGTLEPIQEPAVGKSFKTLCSDWRPGAIAAETLQTLPIFGMNGNVGVDAKARHGGAESSVELTKMAKERGEALGIKVKAGGNRPLQPIVDKFSYWQRASKLETHRVAYWWANRM